MACRWRNCAIGLPSAEKAQEGTMNLALRVSCSDFGLFRAVWRFLSTVVELWRLSLPRPTWANCARLSDAAFAMSRPTRHNPDAPNSYSECRGKRTDSWGAGRRDDGA